MKSLSLLLIIFTSSMASAQTRKPVFELLCKGVINGYNCNTSYTVYNSMPYTGTATCEKEGAETLTWNLFAYRRFGGPYSGGYFISMVYENRSYADRYQEFRVEMVSTPGKPDVGTGFGAPGGVYATPEFPCEAVRY